jgi:hypothetical protein
MEDVLTSPGQKSPVHKSGTGQKAAEGELSSAAWRTGEMPSCDVCKYLSCLGPLMGLGSPNQVENFMVHTLLLALARRKVGVFHFRTGVFYKAPPLLFSQSVFGFLSHVGLSRFVVPERKLHRKSLNWNADGSKKYSNNNQNKAKPGLAE